MVPRDTLLLLSCWAALAYESIAWSPTGSSSSSSSLSRLVLPVSRASLPWRSPTSLAAGADADNNDEQPSVREERVDISGVSISANPPGFFVVVEASRGTLALQVTADPQDAYATTSPEALTLVQLLSGVDMAGAILPPETLAKVLVLSLESIPELFLETEAERNVLQRIQGQLPEGTASYSEAHPWMKSRIKLPQVTLDQVTLSLVVGNDNDNDNDNTNDGTDGTTNSNTWQCDLQCNVKEIGAISVTLTPPLIQAVSYKYDPLASGMFVAIALALRYKAPILLSPSDQINYFAADGRDTSTDESLPSLDTLLPQRTTVAKLQQQSTRVKENIERGFEIHKLTKALEMARKFGDTEAEKKILAELEKFDSFDELPTSTTGSENDISDDSDAGFSEEGVAFGDDDEASFQ